MSTATLHSADDRRNVLAVHGGTVNVTDATVIAAPPSVVTESNCEEKHGVTRRALRKMFRAGLASYELPEVGRACALADLLTFLREHGDIMPAATGGKKAEAIGATPDDAALLAQGGIRMAGGRR